MEGDILRACGGASVQILMTSIFNIRFFWLFLVFLIVLPSAQAAVDEELGALLKSYDSVLSQQEKALASRNRPPLEDLKEFQLVGAEIKTVANDCIVSNQESIDNIAGDVELIGAEGNHEDQVVVAPRQRIDCLPAVTDDIYVYTEFFQHAPGHALVGVIILGHQYMRIEAGEPVAFDTGEEAGFAGYIIAQLK